MTKISLIILIGLPGMGKTNFCENLLKKDIDFNVVHICYDFFIKYDPDSLISYKSQRKNMLDKIKEFLKCINEKNDIPKMFKNSSKLSKDSSNFLILIDDNNYYQSMRYDFYKIAKDYKISFAQIYFSLPLHVALSYNSLKEKEIPEEIILKMNDRLEKPSIKNKWECNTLIICDAQINPEEIYEFLGRSFDFVIEECEKCNCGPSEQTNLHKIDLLLRKQVGSILRNCNGKTVDIPSFAIHLNNKRKQILQDVKNNVIEINDTDFSHLINLI